MIEQDIFVGIVAVVTGLFVLVSAVSNAAWVQRFWVSRKLSGDSDSSVSRVIVFSLGLLCVVLGVLLLLGFFPSKQADGDSGVSAGLITARKCFAAVG